MSGTPVVKRGMIPVTCTTPIEAIKANIQAGRVILRQLDMVKMGRRVWAYNGVEALRAFFSVDSLRWPRRFKF